MEAKFEVRVYSREKPFRIPKEFTEELKGVLSSRKISGLKKEAVDCPVISSEVPFLVCFLCPSFVRRVKGVVYCAGGEGPNWPPNRSSKQP